jgi:hypothetical protein
LSYRFLADAVVLFHFCWIIFILIGGWWGRRYRAIKILHISALVLALLVETFDWFCPLTHLEVWLRVRGAQGSYTGAFITHYLNKLIYLDAPHAPIVVATFLICLGNAWLYLKAGKKPG